MRVVYLFVSTIFALVSCSQEPDFLSQTLTLAGENRPQLERVLAISMMAAKKI